MQKKRIEEEKKRAESLEQKKKAEKEEWKINNPEEAKKEEQRNLMLTGLGFIIGGVTFSYYLPRSLFNNIFELFFMLVGVLSLYASYGIIRFLINTIVVILALVFIVVPVFGFFVSNPIWLIVLLLLLILCSRG